jgi:hypothetical protein
MAAKLRTRPSRIWLGIGGLAGATNPVQVESRPFVVQQIRNTEQTLTSAYVLLPSRTRGAACGSVLGHLSVHVSQFGTTWAQECDYQTRPEAESQFSE